MTPHVYGECSIPENVTLIAWRESRQTKRKRSRWGRMLRRWFG